MENLDDLQNDWVDVIGTAAICTIILFSFFQAVDTVVIGSLYVRCWMDISENFHPAVQ